MNYLTRRTAFIVIVLGLAGCASQDRSYETQPIGLSATDIRGILSGKSWRWSGPNNSGVTLYASDGTSLVEVTGKGTTTGTWSAKDGELCEAFAPAPFLPKGVALNCQPMTGSGNVYQVGQATFTLA
ncbi:MAG TPA: hypothetical protein VJ019_07415 [Aestuariivirga sp.]|nr:hypothetical protein [Aestuariivirga sp.]